MSAQQQQQQDMNDSTSTSPARKTRKQEKEELAYLNDRFASYIEQVRSLKETNLNYEYELKVVKEQLGRESEDIKKLFEAELSDARTLIDETAKEKARQQLIASKNAARAKELETEMKELKEELDAMKNRVNIAERNVTSMDAQRKSAVADKASLQKEVTDRDAEIEELRTNIEELRCLLENETLCKVDLQNNLQSLNEELSFRKKIYEEELQSLRLKISNSSLRIDTSVSQTDGGSLEIFMDELREKSDIDIADFKEMVEASYRDKISKLEIQTSRDATTIGKLNKELRSITGATTEGKAEISKLQKMIEKLEGQLNYKDDEISRMSQKHAGDMANMGEQLRTLRESYEMQMKEYEALMDLKIQLDHEIATYRALLQEEESRLNLTPTPRREKRRSAGQSSEQVIKKPRFDTPVPTQQTTQQQQSASVSSSAAGCIQICDVDATGRFVQIKNMSSSAESVGGFKIVHEVVGEEKITFKFHQKSKLQGGASVTVWGSETSGAVHNPPHDIIWRNQPTWGAGSNAVTKLISKSGEVVATFTQRQEASPAKYDTVDAAGAHNRSFPHLDTGASGGGAGSSSSSRMTRTTTTTTSTSGGGGRSVGHEHMFHQQGDPPRGERLERESCVIS